MAKTLLLADDSATIQRLVKLAFAPEDVTVVPASDGLRAIDLIRQSAPDLVLADIAMPGRTGYEVAAFIRSQPELSSIPVLLLASPFDTVDPLHAQQVGADGVLTKPFDTALLVGRVHELLTAGRQPEAPLEIHPPSGLAALATRRSDSAPIATHGPSSSSMPAAEPRRETSATDRYFEQLDEAFAAWSRMPRSPMPATPESEPPNGADASAVPQPVPVPMLTPLGVPLTDAFAALLDSEQTGVPIVPPQRPSESVPQLDVDQLADQIARKVLAQLSDRVVRETVAEIVSTTTERLVREEIERIKRHIK